MSGIFMEKSAHTVTGMARLPSPAEALAVMAAHPIIMNTVDTPFVDFWNYIQDAGPIGIVEQPEPQYFRVSIMAQEYASGAMHRYELAFHIVLVYVFGTNVFILAYFSSIHVS
jgi:hypothetical protein